MGFFDKLKKINIFSSFGSELTDDFYDELEESLILADTGMDTTLELVEELRRRVKDEHIKTIEEARSCMCRCIADALNAGDVSLNLSTRPSVVLFIGVNGVGKTTTIGKIGYQLRREPEESPLLRRRHLPGRRRRPAHHLGRPGRGGDRQAARGGRPRRRGL